MLNSPTTFQILIIIFGSGAGITVVGFGIRAYINSIVRPRLYKTDGTSIYVPRVECDQSTTEYRDKVCKELEALKNEQKKVVNFQNALRGYYVGKGVKF